MTAQPVTEVPAGGDARVVVTVASPTPNRAKDAAAAADAVLSVAEDDWNSEAAQLVDEVMQSQKQVEALLKQHLDSSQELQAMKESCNEELQELQIDAWKLQMFAELDKMRQQLELLQPLDQDNDDQGDQDNSNDSAQGDAAKAFKDDERPEDLVALDAEIAALDAQLKVARQEAQDMMSQKAQMQQELADMLAQQLKDDEECGDLE